MGYKIGMDFGTTNSTVSYLSNSGAPEAFEFPKVDGYKYIPSCVVYEPDGNVHIGRSALDYAGDPDAVFCSNLKMILPLAEDKRAAFEWAKTRSPETVITDYFKRILADPDTSSDSFTAQQGPIDGIVLSVPHVWAKGMDHAGRSRLQAIMEKELNLPLIQLISEPVAAASYYAYRHQRETSETFTGNLLICDMGGGTFDVTLCRVEPGRVEELHNDGNGRKSLGRAGVLFDRRLIVEKLKAKGASIPEDGPEFYELYDKLQTFKANQRDTITKKMITAAEDPDFAGQPILKAGRYGFNYNDIKQAFADVESGIADVIKRFKSTVNEKGYSIDKIFFVGGFSQFLPVRECIKNALGMEIVNGRLIEDEKREISRFAIAYGAALIAGEKITVEERYEHTIGIEGFTLSPGNNDGEFIRRPMRIPVIAGGQKLSAYTDVHFADHPVKVHNENPDIVIYVDPESKNRIVKESLPESLNIQAPNAHLQGNQWRVGMRINKSKVVYLVFEDAKKRDRVEYELGDIIRKMFGGLEIITGGNGS